MEYITPQNILLAIYLWQFFRLAKMRANNESMIVQSSRALVMLPVFYALFIWGGFFDTIGLPQILMVGMHLYSLATLKDGERVEFNMFFVVLTYAILCGLLWWGGFF